MMERRNIYIYIYIEVSVYVCVRERGRERNFTRGLCSAAAPENKTIRRARWLPNESSLNYQPS